MEIIDSSELKDKIEEKTRGRRNNCSSRTKGKQLNYEYVLKTIKNRIADQIVCEGNDGDMNMSHNYYNCGLDCKYHRIDDDGTHRCECDALKGVIQTSLFCRYKKVRNDLKVKK